MRGDFALQCCRNSAGRRWSATDQRPGTVPATDRKVRRSSPLFRASATVSDRTALAAVPRIAEVAAVPRHRSGDRSAGPRCAVAQGIAKGLGRRGQIPLPVHSMAGLNRITKQRAVAPDSEAALYRPVKRFLEMQGYTVKGEVHHCDLVACRG